MARFHAAFELIQLAQSSEELEQLAAEYGFLDDEEIQTRIFQLRLEEIQGNPDLVQDPPPSSTSLIGGGEDNILTGVCESNDRERSAPIISYYFNLKVN